jgi:Flp pilus assembly protein TadG
MQTVKNEHGYALIFVTVMIVLLLIMVGMALDSGHLAYVRSQGQPAVDAAALAAASAIPSGSWSTVTNRAAKFNPGGTNPGTGNNYLDSPNNAIDQQNVTLVKYDNATGEFATSGVSIANANGARVALENKNPHGGSAGEAMKSPLFLTPLLNLFGQATEGTANARLLSTKRFRRCQLSSWKVPAVWMKRLTSGQEGEGTPAGKLTK